MVSSGMFLLLIWTKSLQHRLNGPSHSPRRPSPPWTWIHKANGVSLWIVQTKEKLETLSEFLSCNFLNIEG